MLFCLKTPTFSIHHRRPGTNNLIPDLTSSLCVLPGSCFIHWMALEPGCRCSTGSVLLLLPALTLQGCSHCTVGWTSSRQIRDLLGLSRLLSMQLKGSQSCRQVKSGPKNKNLTDAEQVHKLWEDRRQTALHALSRIIWDYQRQRKSFYNDIAFQLETTTCAEEINGGDGAEPWLITDAVDLHNFPNQPCRWIPVEGCSGMYAVRGLQHINHSATKSLLC